MPPEERADLAAEGYIMRPPAYSGGKNLRMPHSLMNTEIKGLRKDLSAAGVAFPPSRALAAKSADE
ncbi:MAG: hypothetical protein NTW86_12940 [Candidatus Sumerlaeota bacterium]|nr:hypothetical protein [Candidatus Sumerlaeota bacterium]